MTQRGQHDRGGLHVTARECVAQIDGEVGAAVLRRPGRISGRRGHGDAPRDRRGRISVLISSTALIPGGSKSLEVTYRDFPVPSRHLVTLDLRNSGPKDTSSSMFDSGRSIARSFDSNFYGVTTNNGGVKLISAAVESKPHHASIRVSPGLLRRRSEWSFSALVMGPAETEIESTLIDTDLIEEIPAVDSGIR